jgi:hypothetical protein
MGSQDASCIVMVATGQMHGMQYAKAMALLREL